SKSTEGEIPLPDGGHVYDPVEYAKRHNAFDAVLVAGDRRVSGKAMDIDVNGNGTFLMQGAYTSSNLADAKPMLVSFSPPAYVEGHQAKPHAPSPTQNITQEEMAKAGILSWNEPSHLDANKGVVKERGFPAKFFWAKGSNVGRAAMTGDRMTP